MSQTNARVVVERWLPAPPAVTYSYFTVAEKWIRWNGSAAWIDARPGGSLRIAAYGDFAVGVFEEVVPSSRLVFTWGWESGSPLPAASSLVQVDFEPLHGGTLLRVTHSGLPSGAIAERHQRRWTDYLGVMATLDEPPA